MRNRKNNELNIRSDKFKNIEFWFNKESGATNFQIESTGVDKFLHIDSPEYIYEIYKVLSKADELGYFDKMKKVQDENEEDIPTIYV